MGHLLESFHRLYGFITFRAIGGFLTAFIVCVLLGPYFIRFGRRRFKAGVRLHTPENHQIKGNTPTLGGVLMTIALLIASACWVRFTDPYAAGALITYLLFATIGAWDDLSKVFFAKGVSHQAKWIAQCIALVFVIAWTYKVIQPDTAIYFPLFKQWIMPLGLFFYLWLAFVILATSNGVNLTDGLDGLAIINTMLVYAFYTLVTYAAGHVLFARYLHIPSVPIAELSIICAITLGASLGFLWYNAHPAQIFMGDTGALALGGMLGYIAVISKQELLLPFAAVLLVIETASVILQIVSIRYFKKRIFALAPLHHHFEKRGWHESKITIRATIVTLLGCLAALLLLKLR